MTNFMDKLARRLASNRASQSAREIALQATPAALTDDSPKEEPELLFVQSFTNGAWEAVDTERAAYRLTITGALAQTVYFSDRPDRLFGQVPTPGFIDRIGFTPVNPPNAALVVNGERGVAEEAVVVELTNASYDEANSTLTYEATVLADFDANVPGQSARLPTSAGAPATFAEGGLFIDGLGDCGTTGGFCFQEVDGERVVVGPLDIPLCGKDVIECTECNSDGRSSYYGSRCADAHPDQCSYGTQTIDGETGLFWDCYALGD